MFNATIDMMMITIATIHRIAIWFYKIHTGIVWETSNFRAECACGKATERAHFEHEYRMQNIRRFIE